MDRVHPLVLSVVGGVFLVLGGLAVLAGWMGTAYALFGVCVLVNLVGVLAVFREIQVERREG